MAERLTPERLEYARTSLHLAGNPLMWEVADHIDAQQDEIDRLTAVLAEKKNELAVAYGGGNTEPEQEWFSELDRVKAERDRLRALLWEAREALESTPCDPSGSKCAAHNYNWLPCEVAVVLAKLAQEGLS